MGEIGKGPIDAKITCKIEICDFCFLHARFTTSINAQPVMLYLSNLHAYAHVGVYLYIGGSKVVVVVIL